MSDVTDTTIANEALARLGSPSIMSFEDETKVANKVAQIYPTVVGDAFEANRWHFARRTAPLDRLAAVPVTGYRYAFAMPGNRIGPPIRLLTNPRMPDQPLRVFTVEGDEIHADQAALWGTFVLAVAPRYWPWAFRNAIVTALQAALAVGLTHDTALAEKLSVEAWGTPGEGKRGGLMGRAMARDEATSPGPAPLGASSPLTDAHYAGAWYGDA